MTEINTDQRIGTLRERWSNMAQSHIVFGAGCSCGGGLAAVDLGGFSTLIVAHLRNKYRKAGRFKLASMIPDRQGQDAAAAIDGLLERFTGPSADVTEDDRTALLVDLETALDSFDELHRGQA